jgi:hypothetical protein
MIVNRIIAVFAIAILGYYQPVYSQEVSPEILEKENSFSNNSLIAKHEDDKEWLVTYLEDSILVEPDSFCVSDPLPTTPTGTVWQASVREISETELVVKELYTLTAWRIGCDAENSNVLLRIEPIAESVFICSNFAVIQNGTQFNFLHLGAFPGDIFCGDVTSPTTFLLHQIISLEPETFDDDAGFMLFSTHDFPRRLLIGPYNRPPQGCLDAGITTYRAATGVANLPKVELPDGRCLEVDLQYIPDSVPMQFELIKALPTE